MRGYGLIIGISCAVIVAAWSLTVVVAGVVWILRDSKYLNNVMIPSLCLAAIICAASAAIARRLWRRFRRTNLKDAASF